MVDFSKLQKISNLARELMKLGQASSMDEAMKLASHQIESGTVPEALDVGPTTPLHNTEPQTESEQVQVTESIHLPESDNQNELVTKMQEIINNQQASIAKLSTILNVHTNQLKESVSNQKFNQLVNEITTLKDRVRKLQESPTMPAPQKKTGQTQFKPANPPETSQPEQPKQDSSGHARSGNYKSDDVSIEKFFYYGGK
ncbi:hypothetical protein ACFL0V_03940 [Nanoarchaeota archaeon]